MPFLGVRSAKNDSAAGSAPLPKLPLFLPKARMIPGDGDDEFVRLSTYAQASDWPSLRAALAGYQGDDLSALIARLCKPSAPYSAWLQRTLETASGDPVAATMLGAHTVQRAWAVRTTQRAKHVSAGQFRAFHEMLRLAEQQLFAAVELDPASAAPWTVLLTSGRGLEVGPEVLQRRFEAVVQRSPGHATAHRSMLQSLCAKWSGSHEQMHTFATSAMRGPHGDILGELVPRAHFEHNVYVEQRSPDRRLIRSAETRAELLEAAERTIFRPGYAQPRNPYLAANIFGWAFTAADMKRHARAAFALTEGVVVDWLAFTNPVRGYVQTRNAALNKRF